VRGPSKEARGPGKLWLPGNSNTGFDEVTGTSLVSLFFMGHSPDNFKVHDVAIFHQKNKTQFYGLQCFDAVGWAAGLASGL